MKYFAGACVALVATVIFVFIRCRPVPDATEVHRNFKSPHRVHIFRLTESGCSFAHVKAEAYLRSAELSRQKNPIRFATR